MTENAGNRIATKADYDRAFRKINRDFAIVMAILFVILGGLINA